MRKFALCLVLALLSVALTSVALADVPGEDAVSANPRLPVIATAPDFSLVDIAGKPVKLTDYRGRVVLLAFIFTTCNGVCPLISQQMSLLQVGLKREQLFGERANLLSVTVDPANDTSDVLSAYAQSVHADPAGWRFLRESVEKTKPMLAAYDEWTQVQPKGQFDHPARVYLIDQHGKIREIYSLAFFNEKQALLDIKKLLRDER
jgi:protein SCO1